MRRYLPLLLVLHLALSCLIQQVFAGGGTVYCVNCGTEATQFQNKLQMLQQLQTQARQLQTQIQQYQNMIQHSQTVPEHLWGRTMQNIQKLQTLMERSQAIAATVGNTDKVFSDKYGDQGSYQRMTRQQLLQKQQEWSRISRDNALYTMKALGLHASQMQDEQAVMERLQAMSQTAQGRMQALQVGNMMAAQNVQQLQQLRQLMMLQMQMQANQMATEQAEKEARDASSTKALQKSFSYRYRGKGF
jgi:type IV secretion system protein TrbJ